MSRLATGVALCALVFSALPPACAATPETAAIKATMSAAHKGDAAAQLKLGEAYDLGQGLPQDFSEAVKWYRRAAVQGNAQAQFALAEMYKNGDGVAKDLTEAIKWYRRSADQGNPGAQLLLGVLHESGTGVAEDFTEAARWYRLASGGGDARAQLLLANLYNAGQGVPRNPVVAHALYTVSAQTLPMNNPALGHRVRLAQTMSADELEAATALAQEMGKPRNFLKALDAFLKKPA